MKNNYKCSNQWSKQSARTQLHWENQYNSLTMMSNQWIKNYNFGEDNITHQRQKCKPN